MANESSQLRKRFGKSKAPIKATRAFVRDLPHFSNGRAWILFDDSEGTRISVNTFGENAGKNFAPQPYPIPADEKDLNRLVKGYTEVEVGQCPVAVEAKAKAKAKAKA